MVHACKLLQTLTNNIVVDIQYLCCQTRSHGVELVVLALQTQFFERHTQRCHIWFDTHYQMTAIGICHVLLIAAKRIQCCLWLNTRNLAIDDWVFAPIDKRILARLVARDTELRIHIILELMVVSIQVVRRDIEQDGNIRTEVVAVVQLE